MQGLLNLFDSMISNPGSSCCNQTSLAARREGDHLQQDSLAFRAVACRQVAAKAGASRKLS